MVQTTRTIYAYSLDLERPGIESRTMECVVLHFKATYILGIIVAFFKILHMLLTMYKILYSKYARINNSIAITIYGKLIVKNSIIGQLLKISKQSFRIQFG